MNQQEFFNILKKSDDELTIDELLIIIQNMCPLEDGSLDHEWEECKKCSRHWLNNGEQPDIIKCWFKYYSSKKDDVSQNIAKIIADIIEE